VDKTPTYNDLEKKILELEQTESDRNLAEKGASESEFRYRAIMEASLQGMLQVDVKRRITFANHATAKLTGYPLSELNGLAIEDLFSHGKSKIISGTNIARMCTGKTIIGENILTRKDGCQIKTKFSCAPLLNKNGEYEGFIGSILDITEQVQAEQKSQLQAHVLDQIEDHVTITDLEGVITYVNYAHCRALGCSSDECIGQTTEIYGDDSEQGTTQEVILHNTLRDGSWRGEVVNYTNDGRTIIMDCRTQTIYNNEGNPIALAGIATNITAQKKMEDELIKHRNHLEELVEQRTSQLQQKITEHELTEKKLLHQTEIHKILMNISANCINVPLDKVGEAIQSALKEIGEFVSADRTYIFDYDFEKNIAVNTYEWCNEGVEPQIENLQRSPLEDSPDFIEPHLKGETLIIPDVSALPLGATRDIFEQQKIKSLIAVPLFYEDQLIGFTGSDSVKKFHTHSEKEIELFKFFAQILVNLKMGVRAEETLLNSEKRYRLLAESMNDVIVQISPTGKLVYVSSNIKEFGGYDSESEIGNDMSKYFVNDTDIIRAVELLEKILETHQTGSFEFLFKPKNKKPFYVEHTYFPILKNNKVTIIQLVLRDINDRKLAEDMLAEKTMYLDNILSSSTEYAIATTDIDFRITYYNPLAEQFFGYTADQVIGKTVQEMHIREQIDPKRFEEAIEKVRINGEYCYKVVQKNKNGTRHLDSRVSGIYNTDREIVGFALFTHDVTKKLKAEIELLESEEKYRSMMESMNDAACICSPDFRIVYMNPEMISRIGYDATGQFCHNALYDSDEKCSWCGFDQIWKGEHVEYEWANPNDNRIYNITSSPINHSNGHISKLSIFRDITENKEIEVQSHQAQKMESIGTLAGGIAHDFNNLLYVVMGNISLVQDDLKSETDINKNLKQAQKACIKAKELSAQLITFSKGGDPVKRISSINKVLRDAVISVWQGLDIKPEFLMPDDIRQVDIDNTQIKQAINNIVINAKESMDNKGQLKIMCENIDIAEEGLLTLNQGKYIKISFKDQGCGISKKNLKKIFDPYFSTKKMWTNKGQGIGLTVSYSIIKKHGGLITVESELETGSTFSIYLPSAVLDKELDLQKSEKKLTEPELLKQLDSNERKILLMDDEEAIRDFLGQIIKRLGYDVATCSEGKEAVEIYKKALGSKEPFDLVILDLTNKFGMGGQETMKRLLEIDHNVKGIVITGYSDNPVVTDFKKYGFSGFLTKPATSGELSRAISEVISKGQYVEKST
jgi:PAS domain S-box-containing protein